MATTIQTPADTKLTLDIVRIFSAPLEKVFDAWTGGEQFAAWIGPAFLVRESKVAMDARVGGKYRVQMVMKDGQESFVGGVFRLIERPTRLVLTWAWEPDGEQTLIDITFAATVGGTEMRFRQQNFADTNSRDQHRGGWTMALDQLAALLAK